MIVIYEFIRVMVQFFFPFFFFYILDCFQLETIINLPDVGIHLIHMLGAMISGSQVFYDSIRCFCFFFAFNCGFFWLLIMC